VNVETEEDCFHITWSGISEKPTLQVRSRFDVQYPVMKKHRRPAGASSASDWKIIPTQSITSTILSYEDAYSVLDLKSHKQSGKKRGADECLQVQFQVHWKDDFMCTDWYPFSLPESLMEEMAVEEQQEEIEEEVVAEFSSHPSPSKAQRISTSDAVHAETSACTSDPTAVNQTNGLGTKDDGQDRQEYDSKAVSDEDQRTEKDDHSDVQEVANVHPKKRGRKPKPKGNEKVEIKREFSPQSIPEDQLVSFAPTIHNDDTIGIGKEPFYFGLRFGDPIELLYLDDDEFYNAFAMFYSASSDKSHWNLYVTYDGFSTDNNENLNLADPQTLRRIRPYTGTVKLIETVAYDGLI
jgi:hypothetical protein